MTKKASNYQQKFLSDLIQDRSTVAVYLKNGIKLRGTIIGATKNAIFLDDPMPQLIYKEQISTVCEG